MKREINTFCFAKAFLRLAASLISQSQNHPHCRNHIFYIDLTYSQQNVKLLMSVLNVFKDL